MDVNTLRALLTLACFIVFVGIFVWAYSGARYERFAEAARVPLLDEEPGANAAANEGGHT